ncbi:hypothetical protein EON65_51630 [archaeon]|nr:MAG: hypothetical protein EON65_51630 [archaeon]
MDDTINFAALEDVIEGCRLDEDWIGCKSNLDQYAKIFELTPPYSTPYHPDLKMMKAYYWLCLAECTFSSSGDFDGAIDCLRRGIALRSSHRDLPLVTLRILLRACQDIVLEAFPMAISSLRRTEKVKFEEGFERASLASALGERYTVSSIHIHMEVHICIRIHICAHNKVYTEL